MRTRLTRARRLRGQSFAEYTIILGLMVLMCLDVLPRYADGINLTVQHTSNIVDQRVTQPIARMAHGGSAGGGGSGTAASAGGDQTNGGDQGGDQTGTDATDQNNPQKKPKA